MEFTRTDLDSEAIKPEICSIKPVTRGLNADNFPSKRLPYFGIVHRDGKTPSFVFFEIRQALKSLCQHPTVQSIIENGE